MAFGILTLIGWALSIYYWKLWLTDETYTDSNGKQVRLTTSIWSPVFISGLVAALAGVRGIQRGSAYMAEGNNFLLALIGLIFGTAFISTISFIIAWLAVKALGNSSQHNDQKKAETSSQKMKGAVRNRNTQRKDPIINSLEAQGARLSQDKFEEKLEVPVLFGEILKYSDEVRDAYELTKHLPAKVRTLFIDTLMLEGNKEKKAREVAREILERYDEFYFKVYEGTDVEQAEKYLSILDTLGEGVDKDDLSQKFINENVDRKNMLPPLKIASFPAELGVFEDVGTKMRFRVNGEEDIVCLTSNVVIHDWNHLKEMYPNFRLVRRDG